MAPQSEIQPNTEHDEKSSSSFPDTKAAGWDANALKGNPHGRIDKAERVREMFTAIAHAYDINNRVHSFWLDQSWRRRAVRLADPVRGASVLDVACGTGDLAQAFVLAGAGKVIGLDYTPAMLDYARSKATRIGGRISEIQYVDGDAQSLPYPDQSFDIVSIAFGIRNVADPLKAIREFRRVLKPNGRLVILEFSQPRNAFVRFFHNLYTNHIMPWTATILARDGSGAYRYLPRSVETFLDPNQLSDQLISVGFFKVSQQELTMGTCVISIGEIAN